MFHWSHVPLGHMFHCVIESRFHFKLYVKLNQISCDPTRDGLSSQPACSIKPCSRNLCFLIWALHHRLPSFQPSIGLRQAHSPLLLSPGLLGERRRSSECPASSRSAPCGLTSRSSPRRAECAAPKTRFLSATGSQVPPEARPRTRGPWPRTRRRQWPSPGGSALPSARSRGGRRGAGKGWRTQCAEGC